MSTIETRVTADAPLTRTVFNRFLGRTETVYIRRVLVAINRTSDVLGEGHVATLDVRP